MDDKTKRFMDAVKFLEEHPALNKFFDESPICEGLWYRIWEFCKHGHIESEYVIDEGSSDDPAPMVTHEERYGEPWSFDHLEYWWELIGYVYLGVPCRRYPFSENTALWHVLPGPESKDLEISARTFEDCIIQAAEAAREFFGDYSLDDMLTLEERDGRDNPDSPHGEKYFNLSEFSLNRRWFERWVEDHKDDEEWMDEWSCSIDVILERIKEREEEQ
jgi:hypothetical protein